MTQRAKPPRGRKRHPRSTAKLPPTPENVEKRQAIWLAAYRQCGTVRKTEEVTGINRSTHAEWLRTCPSYVEKLQEAKDSFVETLEEEADRRGYHGIRRKKFHPLSKRAYYELEYSDTLLIFRLKALAPEKYRERYESTVNATVAQSGPIIIQLPATEPYE